MNSSNAARIIIMSVILTVIINTALSYTVVMYVTPDSVNVTVDYLGSLPGIQDDEICIETNTSNGFLQLLDLPNGCTQLLPDSFELGFRLILSAHGYNDESYILSPEKAHLVIGTDINNRHNMKLIEDAGMPVVDSMWTEPEHPSTDDNITVYARATDEDTGGDDITNCSLKIDGKPKGYMESTYDSSNITAHKLIGTLSAGAHSIDVVCKDDFSGWGVHYIESFTVTQAEEEEEDPEDPEDPEEPEEPEIKVSDKVIQLRRYDELMNKIEILSLLGDNYPEARSKLIEAGEKIINDFNAESLLNEVEEELPVMIIEGEGELAVKPVTNKQDFIKKVIDYENIPQEITEVKSLIRREGLSYEKSFTWFTINDEDKSLITLKVLSEFSRPDYIVIDVLNHHSIEAVQTIHYDGKSMTYWKGLKQGVNEFQYITNGFVNEGFETIIFEFPEIPETNFILEGITGAAAAISKLDWSWMIILLMGGALGLVIGKLMLMRK